MLTELEPTEIPGHQPSGLGSDDHPMRVMTRRAAGLAPGGWDDAARAEVAAFFDALAPSWESRTTPERAAVVTDCLERGLPPDLDRAGVCVEVGSGTGAYTAALAERWATVLAVEVSLEMSRRAPAAPGHRVIADGARLPLADGAAAAVVLVNAFLFPAEVERVLGPGGVVVWVNSSGPETPIHLPAGELVATLPGRWDAVHSRAGAGTWAVARRAR